MKTNVLLIVNAWIFFFRQKSSRFTCYLQTAWNNLLFLSLRKICNSSNIAQT